MLIQQFYAPRPFASVPSRAEAEWHSSRELDPLLDCAMATARIGVWSCDLADSRLSWSSGVYDLFGLSTKTELDRRQTVKMYTDESREALERLRSHAIATRGTFTLDAQIMRHSGDMKWMRVTGVMSHNAFGAPLLHGLKQDITEEKLRSEELRRLAENDALTGLANRALFESRFLNRCCSASGIVPLGALILFDLNGFKGINDRLGHLAGDACLKVFAERLSASFPNALLTARIGGDEFAVLISDDKPVPLIKAHLARFLSEMRAPILWREHIFKVGAAHGIAFPTDPYRYDPEELFVSADDALYAAKRATKRSGSSCRA